MGENNIALIVLMIGLGIALAFLLYFSWQNIRADLGVSSASPGA